jgi:hypothetical protein
LNALFAFCQPLIWQGIGSLASILENFGYANVMDDLNGDKIHRLENVLTLASGQRIFFEELDIWLTKTVCALTSPLGSK